LHIFLDFQTNINRHVLKRLNLPTGWPANFQLIDDGCFAKA